MTLDIDKFDAIIFDLGGVIINLDPNATIIAFAQLSGKSPDEIAFAYENSEFFKQYEIGSLSDEEFRASIRNSLQINASDQLIDNAWNAMLLEIPINRLDAFKQLKRDFRLFVMSNTNDIHIRKFNGVFNELSSGNEFKTYFDKVYYSQEIGARKPNANAWTPILKENKLEANRVLFIDDRLDNIKAAHSLGIQTLHNKNLDDWLSILN